MNIKWSSQSAIKSCFNGSIKDNAWGNWKPTHLLLQQQYKTCGYVFVPHNTKAFSILMSFFLFVFLNVHLLLPRSQQWCLQGGSRQPRPHSQDGPTWILSSCPSARQSGPRDDVWCHKNNICWQWKISEDLNIRWMIQSFGFKCFHRTNAEQRTCLSWAIRCKKALPAQCTQPATALLLMSTHF